MSNVSRIAVDLFIAVICIVMVSLLIIDPDVDAAMDAKTKLVVGFFGLVIAVVAIRDAFAQRSGRRSYR